MAGGQRNCWLRLPVSKARKCALRGSVELAIVVVGVCAGVAVEFASDLMALELAALSRAE